MVVKSHIFWTGFFYLAGGKKSLNSSHYCNFQVWWLDLKSLGQQQALPSYLISESITGNFIDWPWLYTIIRHISSLGIHALTSLISSLGNGVLSQLHPNKPIGLLALIHGLIWSTGWADMWCRWWTENYMYSVEVTARLLWWATCLLSWTLKTISGEGYQD